MERTTVDTKNTLSRAMGRYLDEKVRGVSLRASGGGTQRVRYLRLEA